MTLPGGGIIIATPRPIIVNSVGLTVADVWSVALDAIPAYNLMGQRLPDSVIEGYLAAAINKVELDLDVLIALHEIRCVADQGDADDDSEDNVIYAPPLDKPKNWFQGDRQGIVQLPYRPVQKLVSVIIKPYGFGAIPLKIPHDRFRVTSRGFSVVPGPQGYILPMGMALPGFYSIMDGHRIPGGLEVIYQAGLGKRGLKQYPILKTLILIEAALLALGSLNIMLGGGVAKEQLASDGLENTVELQRGILGPLGGPIKNLSGTFNTLLASARAALTLPKMTWLG